MTAREIIEASRAAWGALAAGDLAALRAVADPDVEIVVPADMPLAGSWRGPDGMVAVWEQWMEPFERFDLEVNALTVRGDVGIASVRFDTTGKGSGVEVSGHFHYVGRWRDRSLIWAVVRQDAVAALGDVGLTPPFTAFLGLGSNLGERRDQLQAAVDALSRHGVRVVASSSTYDTDPVGEVLDQPAFLNACVRIETELPPEDLLDACKAVERELGRAAGGVRHGPRPIDVDVLLFEDLVHESERLALPHSQVTARRFVLIPLLELDLALSTPDGVGLADALAALPVDEGVRRAGPPLRLPSRAASPAYSPAGDR